MTDDPMASGRASSKAPSPQALERRAFLLVVALVAVAQGTTSVFVPALPGVVDALSADVAAVNMTMTAFLFGFAACQLIYGPLSDRFGRRPVLIGGLCLYVAATVFCAFAATIEELVVGRLLQGMAVCVGPVVGRAVIRDTVPVERSAKVMANIGVAMAATPALAPAFGGVLEEAFGWRAIFAALVVAGLLLLLAIGGALPETSPAHRAGRVGDRATLRRSGGLITGWRTLLGSAPYWGYTLAVASVFSALMAYTVGVPFVIIDLLGWSPAWFGALAALNVLGFFVGSLISGRCSTRLGIDRLLLIGLILATAGSVVMAGLGIIGILSVVAVIAPMMLFTTGLGIVLANGMAGAMAPFPSIAGAASSLLGFLQMTAAGLGALAVGAFEPTSQVPMAVVMAIASTLGLAAFLVLVRRRELQAR